MTDDIRCRIRSPIAVDFGRSCPSPSSSPGVGECPALFRGRQTGGVVKPLPGDSRCSNLAFGSAWLGAAARAPADAAAARSRARYLGMIVPSRRSCITPLASTANRRPLNRRSRVLPGAGDVSRQRASHWHLGWRAASPPPCRALTPRAIGASIPEAAVPPTR